MLGLSKEANHAVGIFVGILINRNRESPVFIRVLRLDMNDTLSATFCRIPHAKNNAPASQRIYAGQAGRSIRCGHPLANGGQHG